jgi:hypothetical protein
MLFMDREDGELQIKLAQLQTDVQIYLTISVSILAVCFAFIISFQQLSLQATEAWQKYVYLFGMVANAVIAYYVTRMYIGKMIDKRGDMEKLRKEYVW